MLINRTNMGISDLPSVIALLNQCSVGLAVLNAEAQVCWMNAAFAESFSGARSLLGDSIAGLDAEAPRLLEAAKRAQVERRAVLLRAARLGIRAHETSHDVAFTPLDMGGLLCEIYPLAQVMENNGVRLSESLRGFAHEVKNPLAGVRGAAQLLQRRLNQPDLAEWVELIIAEADRLTELADRLLRSNGKPRLARTNLHETLERVSALLTAENSALHIERDYDPSLPTVVADVDRIQQLILNLARNSIEANARKVVFRTRAERGVRLGERLLRLVLRLDVIDDGCGVPAEIIETLFQPLVSGRVNGTGLGLALAQEIAHEHGGSLHYTKRLDNSVFTLLLPLGEHHE